MAYLALAWKLFGYAPAVTHVAILLIAALALLGVFVLAQFVANRNVAVASTLCTALYPVFFAQSSIAHVDLAAAAFTIWGVFFYLKQRRGLCVGVFVLAALAKETAIITPFALFASQIVGRKPRRMDQRLTKADVMEQSLVQRILGSIWLLAPALPLAAWFAYHYAHTGYIFGNPQFFRYNVATTFEPRRILFAFLARVWQLLGHMYLWVPALITAAVLLLPPKDSGDGGVVRHAISGRHRFVFAVVIITYAVVLSMIGGALLARYMLPAVPFVIIIAVSVIWRRVSGWAAVIALVCAAFAAGLVTNPPYVCAPEDGLGYRDFVILHQQAVGIVEERFPQARVLTAWPATDELSKPWLGYVPSAHKLVQLEDFTSERLKAVSQNDKFDIAIIFSRKYEPPHRLPLPAFWKRTLARYFDDRPNTPPEAAAQILGGSVFWKSRRGGQWIAIITIPQPGVGSATALAVPKKNPQQ
jgi:hypothetical protein